jgi:hypothetical protein
VSLCPPQIPRKNGRRGEEKKYGNIEHTLLATVNVWNAGFQ